MKLLATLVLLAGSLTAQTIGQAWRYQTVVLAGNSLSQFQAGIAAQYELTAMAPGRVLVRGHDSYTCPMVLSTIQWDVFGSAQSPINPSVVLLFDSTGDVIHGTSIASHMTCLAQTIATLIAIKPSLQIVLSNVPPMTADNCYGDLRSQIATYNAAIPQLAQQFPTNVTVLDNWTPNVQDDGWAIPSHMTGPCGVHFGDAGVWVPGSGWDLASPIWRDAIYTVLQAKR